jgi:hypothetical protein
MQCTSACRENVSKRVRAPFEKLTFEELTLKFCFQPFPGVTAAIVSPYRHTPQAFAPTPRVQDSVNPNDPGFFRDPIDACACVVHRHGRRERLLQNVGGKKTNHLAIGVPVDVTHLGVLVDCRGKETNYATPSDAWGCTYMCTMSRSMASNVCWASFD